MKAESLKNTRIFSHITKGDGWLVGKWQTATYRDRFSVSFQEFDYIHTPFLLTLRILCHTVTLVSHLALYRFTSALHRHVTEGAFCVSSHKLKL
jgi:hypothetical protein